MKAINYAAVAEDLRAKRDAMVARHAEELRQVDDGINAIAALAGGGEVSAAPPPRRPGGTRGRKAAPVLAEGEACFVCRGPVGKPKKCKVCGREGCKKCVRYKRCEVCRKPAAAAAPKEKAKGGKSESKASAEPCEACAGTEFKLYRCVSCGKKLCRTCLNKGEDFQCEDCVKRLR